MSRHILHADLDTFFVSVQRLHNKGLIGKPVIIGGSSDRGVVAACSYEARQFGVYSSMPIKLARQLCPHACFVKGDYEDYGKFSKMVTEILTDKLPVVEKASIDEFYADMSGMDKFFGCYKYASELSDKVMKETGLPISFGLSVNKTVSKIATGLGKPIGKMQVSAGTERHFLAPLSIRKIPMIGDEMASTLMRMGLTKIGTIQDMDIEAMHSVLGKNGVTVWNKANGIDDSPVVPYHEQKSMSHSETFEKDTTDMEFLTTKLRSFVSSLSFELRQQVRLTACISVKIRYADFNTYTQQAKIAHTASEATLTEKALELFHKLYSRRQLIRLLGITFTQIVTGGQQINLFSNTIKDTNLNRAMDSIRSRFGFDLVTKATLVPHAH